MPVLDKFEILICAPPGGSLLQKQVPVNKTCFRRDLLFSKFTGIEAPQVRAISQFLDKSVSTKMMTLLLAHEGRTQSAISLPAM